MNTYKFPHLSGLKADVTLVKKGDNDIAAVKLTMADGSKIKPKKTYRVVTNSYVIATYKGEPLSSTPTVLNTTTSELTMQYLERQKTVSYQGRSQVNYLSPNE